MKHIQLRHLTLLLLAGILFGCGHNSVAARQEALRKGKEYYQKGSFGDAQIQFRRALQEDPRSGEACLWLGRTDKQQGNYQAAVDNLNRAVSLLPDHSAPKVELVNILLLSYLSDPARPAEIFKKISQLSDELLTGGVDAFDGTRIQGYLALAQGNAKTATGFFQEANQMKPNEPDVIAGLVESLELDKQAPRAEQVARDFLRVNPGYAPIYTILYQRLMAARRFDDAESLLKEEIAHDSKSVQYRIELARHYARTGKNPQMSETLDQLLDNPKQFPGALLPVADFYSEIRNWEEARRLYQRGLETDAKLKMLYRKRLVRVGLDSNDTAAAQRLLDQILKEYPDDVEAQASQAALWMASKDPQQQARAGAEFKALVAKYPENPGYRLQYAEALRAMGDPDSAQAQYIAILQRQPKNLAVLQTMADLSIRRQRFTDALGYAQRALDIDPRSVRARLVESAALASEHKFAETRAVLTDVTRDNPNLREAQFQLALLDVEEKRFAEAEKRFLKYYQPGKGDIRALEGLVELYRAQGQLGKAISLLRQDLQKGPQYDDVRGMLAGLAEQSGQTDLAIEQYELLARAKPESAEVRLHLGISYQKKHDAARAAQEFDRATKLAPRDALAFAYLGQALDDSGHKPEAVAADRQSLSLDNRNPWVMNNLAFLLAETNGSLDEAMKLAQEAVRLHPEDVSFSDTLGWIYLKKGDSPSAAHIFESDCQKSPREVTFRIHLATALIASGDVEKSRSQLAVALQLASSPEERDSIARLLEKAKPIKH